MRPTDDIRATSRIGGHPVLDLANTVRWRLDPNRRDDVLVDFGAAVRFAADVELLTHDEATTLVELASRDDEAAQMELGSITGLREASRAVLLSGDSPRVVVEAYQEAVAESDIVSDEGTWRWQPPVDLRLIRRRIAFAAMALMTTPSAGLTRECGDAHCGWVYLDRSSRHDRRWCSSSDCGNRNRVREHYQRQRQTLESGRGRTSASDAADLAPMSHLEDRP